MREIIEILLACAGMNRRGGVATEPDRASEGSERGRRTDGILKRME